MHELKQPQLVVWINEMRLQQIAIDSTEMTFSSEF